MKTIKITTVKGQGFINDYKRAYITDIYQAYERPSYYKVQAWNKCKRKAMEHGSIAYITGYNCNFFTVMFKTDEGLQVETGRNTYLVVEG